jgi:hypothetical protein
MANPMLRRPVALAHVEPLAFNHLLLAEHDI